MTTETDLLPLPGPDYLMPQGQGWPDIPAWSENTVRQIVAHATAPLQAEIEALRAEVERLRAIAGCAYQMAGVHDAPEAWLDRLSQAANGDALPDPDTISDELLPYQPGAVCEAEARADKLAEALEEIRSRSSINLAMHPDPSALTARLGDIYQIADAALAREGGQ